MTRFSTAPSTSSFHKLCILSGKISHVNKKVKITNSAVLSKHGPWKFCTSRAWRHQKSRGSYAVTLMKSTIQESATQIQWETFQFMMNIFKRKERKAPAPSEAEIKIFPKRGAPRKLHRHTLKVLFWFSTGQTIPQVLKTCKMQLIWTLKNLSKCKVNKLNVAWRNPWEEKS